jgi:hypothetical protein
MRALGALYPKERPSSPVAFSAWLRGSRRGGFHCGAYSERASDDCLLACSKGISAQQDESWLLHVEIGVAAVRYHPGWVLIFAALTPLIAAVGGCTFSLHDSLFAAPGKFDSLDCTAIAENIKAITAREKQLNELIRRDTADGGSAGANALVYQDDLNAVRENLWGLRQASDAKHCPPLMTFAQ